MNRDEIINSLKEMRDVCAFTFRFVDSNKLNDKFLDTLDMYYPHLQKGFGTRCQDIIARLEEGEEIISDNKSLKPT